MSSWQSHRKKLQDLEGTHECQPSASRYYQETLSIVTDEAKGQWGTIQPGLKTRRDKDLMLYFCFALIIQRYYKSDYLNGKSIHPITSRHFILMLEIHNNTYWTEGLLTVNRYVFID